jgi:hypothetical protein
VEEKIIIFLCVYKICAIFVIFMRGNHPFQWPVFARAVCHFGQCWRGVAGCGYFLILLMASHF